MDSGAHDVPGPKEFEYRTSQEWCNSQLQFQEPLPRTSRHVAIYVEVSRETPAKGREILLASPLAMRVGILHVSREWAMGKIESVPKEDLMPIEKGWAETFMEGLRKPEPELWEDLLESRVGKCGERGRCWLARYVAGGWFVIKKGEFAGRSSSEAELMVRHRRRREPGTCDDRGSEEGEEAGEGEGEKAAEEGRVVGSRRWRRRAGGCGEERGVI